MPESWARGPWYGIKSHSSGRKEVANVLQVGILRGLPVTGWRGVIRLIR